MKYNAIWISDLHLGSKHSQADLLLSFLHNHECRHLYLVGDIIDGWELRRRWLWSSDANTVIQKILRMNRKQTQVTYVFGNHDEFMEQFLGLNLGGVRLVERAIHEGLDGRRYLVLHGHQLDGLVLFNRLLERVGARLYDGDWVESCTALAEDFEGNIHLLRLDDSKNTPLNNPAVGEDANADRTRMRRSELSARRSAPIDPVRETGSLSEDLPLFRNTGPGTRERMTPAAELRSVRRRT